MVNLMHLIFKNHHGWNHFVIPLKFMLGMDGAGGLLEVMAAGCFVVVSLLNMYILKPLKAIFIILRQTRWHSPFSIALLIFFNPCLV